MTFTWKDDLIWAGVAVEYEGVTYTIDDCLVDTGSATTAIDIDCVAFNFQKPGVLTRLFGIGGGTQEVIAQTIDGITIDSQRIEDIDIEFGNLRSELGINGFVGNDILSRFTLTIEYATQHITLRR